MIQRAIAILKNRMRPANSEFICLSPVCEISQLIIHTTLKIIYKRPAARGRQMLGALVPFGTLWRTGAGACTTLYFSEPVCIRETKIESGSYALFSIPGAEIWTMILNEHDKQDGVDEYDAAKDITRFEVPVQRTSRFYESFSIDIDVVNNNTGVVYLSWEHTQVCFPVTVTVPENADYINRLQQL